MSGTAQHHPAAFGPTGPEPWRPSPQPFTIANALGVGWDGFSRSYGLLLGATALYVLIVIGGKIIAVFTQFFTILPLIDWAVSFFFFPILFYGLLDIGRHRVAGRPATVSMLFSPFNRYFPVVGVNVLVTLGLVAAVYAPLIVGALSGLLLMRLSASSYTFISLIVGVSLVTYALVFFVLMPRVMFAPMICLDTDVRTSGPIESIRLAWRMTRRRGVRPRLAALVALGGVLLLACVLLMIVPAVLLAIPLSVAVYGAAYWQISSGYWASLEHCCRACEYDLRDVKSDRCPECGEPVPEDQLSYTGLADPSPDPEPGRVDPAG